MSEWNRGNWFVGVPIASADWLPELKHHAPAGLRFFDPADVHLTIAFLGRLTPDRVEKVIAALDAIPAAEFPLFKARLGRLLLLPSPRRFSAVSFSLDAGAEQAAQLMGRHREIFYSAAAVPGDTRAPLPHITIARPRRGLGADELREIDTWAQSVEPPQFELQIGVPVLYCWARDRGERQFEVYHQPVV